MPSEAILVLTTAPTEEAAAQLARGLVESHLAACVHIDAIRSLYRWQGEVHDEPEWRLTIKTSATRYAEVEQFLRTHHPYQIPEIVRLDLTGGSEDYLRWIDACTGSPS